MANNGVFFRNFKLEVCKTAQPNDLNEAGFELLTYVEVCCLAEVPEFSSETNVITENCIDGRRLIGIGADEPSDLEISVFYMQDCEGQEFLRQAAGANDGAIYAFRKVYSDGVSGVSTPTTVYVRGMITSFSDGSGGIEDLVQHTFGGSILQGPVFVGPENI